MNKTNMRYIFLMNEAIQNYENKHISLAQLVNKLDQIILNFDSPSRQLKESLKEAWFDLEQINANLLNDVNQDEKVNLEAQIPLSIQNLKDLLRCWPSQ